MFVRIPCHSPPVFRSLAWQVLLLLAVCCGCSTGIHPETRPATRRVVYAVAGDATRSLLHRFAPVYTVVEENPSDDRIGRAAIRRDDTGAEETYVDPRQPVVYAEERMVNLPGGGGFRNLIYRVHFPAVPFRLLPLQLTAGRNGGLIVIISLDSDNLPLLVTTVHTCGCYLAMFPTSNLKSAELPPGWNPEKQEVYGISLPGTLRADPAWADAVPVVMVTGEMHRIAGIAMVPRQRILAGIEPVALTVMPMAALERLPLPDGGYSSFFHEEGREKGYVKGSDKVLERFLIGWWALDWNVGADKKLGLPEEGGAVFYTSLKFWDRHRSDLRDFPRFLDYWGWNLPGH
ncbi:MAG: hypothetical protein AB1568_00305 [Thermodesulfobacteriota bacterium]